MKIKIIIIAPFTNKKVITLSLMTTSYTCEMVKFAALWMSEGSSTLFVYMSATGQCIMTCSISVIPEFIKAPKFDRKMALHDLH